MYIYIYISIFKRKQPSSFFSAREAAQIAQSQVAWNIAEAAKWITGV